MRCRLGRFRPFDSRDELRTVHAGQHGGFHLRAVVLLLAARHPRSFVDMLGVARRTPGLFDGLAHQGDDDVVGETAFAGTVVVHDVAETQRTLLHSVTPRARHCTVIVHTLARPTGFRRVFRATGAFIPRSDLTSTRQDVAFLAGHWRIASSG